MKVKNCCKEERNLIDLLKLEVSSKKDPLGLEAGGPGRGGGAELVLEKDRRMLYLRVGHIFNS